MGKGDKKTRKGKIVRGSYGNKRPKKASSGFVAVDKPAKKIVSDEQLKDKEPVKAPTKPKAEKKPAVKKSTDKKEETPKS